MENRVQRINKVIKEELGKILIRELDLSEVLLTVTRVDTSSNIQESKVYISIMPEDRFDDIFNFISKDIYSIQQELNKRLNMRPVPKIIFIKEEKTKKAARIEELLEEIKDKEN